MKLQCCQSIAILAVTLGIAACSKQDPVVELEKSSAQLEKLEQKTPPPKSDDADGGFDPSKYIPPAKQLKEAVAEFKSGKMEDAVTRLQLLRAQPTLTPEQRVAVQDGVAALMSEIYAQAEKGDARARAAVVQYEKMQSGAR